MAKSNEKVCTKCREPKPVPEGFQRIPDYIPGTWRLHSWCRECNNRDSAARRRTPLGKLRNQLYVWRFRLRRTRRERVRLADRIVRLEAEIRAMMEVRP